MKARKIIQRPILFTAKELKINRVYRCERFKGKVIGGDSFWYGATIWRWENDYCLDTLGTVQMGNIAAIQNGILFPSVKFENEFLFAELSSPKEVESFRCRNKKYYFIKRFLS